MRYTPAATLQYPYLMLHQFVYLHSGGLIGSRIIAGQAAQDHWRMVSAPHLVALVRAGARFERGVLTGRPEPAAA